MSSNNREIQEPSSLIEELKDTINQQKKILIEIKTIYGIKYVSDKELISMQTTVLIDELRKLNEKINKILSELILPKSFFHNFFGISSILNVLKKEENLEPDELEKETFKRLRQGEELKKQKPKIKSEEIYTKISNTWFSNKSKNLVKGGYFKGLGKDLERTNLKYTTQGYVSIILLSTFLSFIGGLLILIFFSLFKISATLPLITFVEDFSSKFISLIWIPILFPIAGFIISYSYPSLEKKSSEAQ